MSDGDGICVSKCVRHCVTDGARVERKRKKNEWVSE